MQIRVLLFAGLRERLGTAELVVEVGEGALLGDVLDRVREEHEDLAGQPFAIALNQAYATEDDVVQKGDEVALIPPVSGG